MRSRRVVAEGADSTLRWPDISHLRPRAAIPEPSADRSGLSRAVLHSAAFKERHLPRTVVHNLKAGLGGLWSTVIDLSPRAAVPFPCLPACVGLGEEDRDVAV
jgi:hypothetical protein